MPRIRKEKNRNWSKEEKIRIINRHLIDGLSTDTVAKEEDISGGMLRSWIKKYLELGPESLVNKKKPGNPLTKYSNKKQLTKEESIEILSNLNNEKNHIMKKCFENKILKEKIKSLVAVQHKKEKEIKFLRKRIEEIEHNPFEKGYEEEARKYADIVRRQRLIESIEI